VYHRHGRRFQTPWYHLTPDRVVVALLILEGFLILSERFEWFAFNRHKGWTVLVGLAAIPAAMLLMFFWFVLCLIFKRRFQFSILSLLVLTVVVAVPCSWLAVAQQQARKQREVIKAIEKAGWMVSYDYEQDPCGGWMFDARPPEPPWLHKLLGSDLFANAMGVSFEGSEVTDAAMEPLRRLPRLQSLTLVFASISDAGLENLKRLPQLRCLSFFHTDVSDAGLQHLKGLTQLREVGLYDTKVNDAGAADLQKALLRARITVSRGGVLFDRAGNELRDPNHEPKAAGKPGP
jgi:hypothetical protein